ncbi:MAG: AmmeMemoRadiSam system radical SAM enzyme [Thermoplasmatales archaeon]|nr:AmmeMemoRadiSam system radical SAM enzyme [Thermoplasmatales archaeon]
MAATSPVRMEARYYRRDGDVYVCGLCPHRCRIGVGKYGRCGARRGDPDYLVADTYGRVSSLCVDPVEKKPLYHYKPGSRIFSVGSVGCNMTCKHCQNYSISQSPAGRKRTTYKSPQDLAAMCNREKSEGIAFTYNEPTIWIEYIQDTIRCDPDLECVLISNGLICEEPLRDLCKIADAVNFDVKGFTDKFYTEICGAHLEDVLKAVKIAYEEKVHIELTYLLIPDHNDSPGEIKAFAEWVVRELSPYVPVHFSRFHPDNEMGMVPWTPQESLEKAMDIAEEAGLKHVYIGNIITDDGSDTFCPECGNVVIKRTGYLIDIVGLNGDRCSSCRTRLNIIR